MSEHVFAAKYFKHLACLESGESPKKEAGIFGSLFSREDASLIIQSCPWEATASFGLGTRLGPESIQKASHQLDLESAAWGPVYRQGLFLDQSLDQKVAKLNDKASQLVCLLRSKQSLSLEEKQNLSKKVDSLSEEMTDLLAKNILRHLESAKKVCLLGGDHSSSFALAKAFFHFDKRPCSLLHLDAHFDLRSSYEGFLQSHASIIYNLAKTFPQIESITHLGIRDYCKKELDWVKKNSKRSKVFFDRDIHRRLLGGESFSKIAAEIIATLSDRIYLSFDIDCLTPSLCPGTGTPVPGGLSYPQISFLLEEIKRQKKELVTFDLVEVAGGNTHLWDANVGARLLYQLCGLLLS